MSPGQRPSIPWGVVVLATLVSAIAGWWLASEAPPPPPTPTPAHVQVAAPAPIAVVAPPPGATADKPAGSVFSDGFCAQDGADSTITIEYTIERLLADEAQRRLDALPPEARALVFHSVDEFLRTAHAPADVSPTNVLLVALWKPKTEERALALAEQLLQHDSDPYLQVARAVAAERLGRSEVVLDAVRKARRDLPKDPALGGAVALALRETPELDEAISGLDAYLAVDPVPALSRIRARLIVARDIQRDYLRRTSDGVTLLWPSGVLSEAQADGVLHAIGEALSGSARFLGVSRRSRLLAVVYPSRSEILAVTCVRGWAGAVYDGTLRLAAAPSQPSGVQLEQLRHETTHATLHAFASGTPLWFDEGVAQVFANQRERRAAWRAMVRNRTWIPFESLDGSFHVFDQSQDAELAYAESQALVELMRDRGGDRAIAEAVRAFREGAKTPAVLAHATGQASLTGEDLLAFLSQKLGADP